MTEQLLAREAGLALPGWVTRERLSDSSLVPSGRQAPASPLCGHSAPLGSHRRTLSCLLLSGVEGLSRRQAVGGRGVAGEAPGQTAGLAPRRGRPWGRRHPRAQRQRSIRSLPSPLQPRNSLSEAPRDTAQNATVGGSLGSSSRRPQGAQGVLTSYATSGTQAFARTGQSLPCKALPLWRRGFCREAPVIGREGLSI